MAPKKTAVDLNTMLNKDRQRRKNEALAHQIFSKHRRASAPGAGMISHKPSAVPSLASRIGVAKRNSSVSSRGPQKQKPAVGNVNAEWTHDLHNLNSPPPAAAPRGPRATRENRNQKLYSTLSASISSPVPNSQFNIIGSAKPAGMSIRGLAGPYIVVIKNLAPGTTIADLESAITPIGGAVLKCNLIAERPKVIAEVEFETKGGADNAVDTLNNQPADGNILHVYHKIGSSPFKNIRSPSTPVGPRADNAGERSDDNRSGYTDSERYTQPDRRRDEREDVVDGSYGFDDRMDTDEQDGYNSRGRGGLYSDNLVGNRGRGRGDSRDRGRANGGRGYR